MGYPRFRQTPNNVDTKQTPPTTVAINVHGEQHAAMQQGANRAAAEWQGGRQPAEQALVADAGAVFSGNGSHTGASSAAAAALRAAFAGSASTLFSCFPLRCLGARSLPRCCRPHPSLRSNRHCGLRLTDVNLRAFRMSRGAAAR